MKIRRAHKEELLGEYTDGFTTEESVVADTDVYMNFLLNKAKQVGLQIVVKEVCIIRKWMLFTRRYSL